MSVAVMKRRTLHEELAESLENLIVSGELPPGAKISEKALCERFAVSRTPLREALKVLAADGLVQLEANRGAFVRTITVADLEEVFPVMGALEALSGELACRNITDAEIAAIRADHDAMVRHFHARDLNAYFAANQAIHEQILDAARNPTLSAHYRSLAARVRRMRYVANMTDARWAAATAEHEQIMACLERRDGAALANVLRDHLAAKLEAVRAWLCAQTPQ